MLIPDMRRVVYPLTRPIYAYNDFDVVDTHRCRWVNKPGYRSLWCAECKVLKDPPRRRS